MFRCPPLPSPSLFSWLRLEPWNGLGTNEVAAVDAGITVRSDFISGGERPPSGGGRRRRKGEAGQKVGGEERRKPVEGRQRQQRYQSERYRRKSRFADRLGQEGGRGSGATRRRGRGAGRAGGAAGRVAVSQAEGARGPGGRAPGALQREGTAAPEARAAVTAPPSQRCARAAPRFPPRRLRARRPGAAPARSRLLRGPGKGAGGPAALWRSGAAAAPPPPASSGCGGSAPAAAVHPSVRPSVVRAPEPLQRRAPPVSPGPGRAPRGGGGRRRGRLSLSKFAPGDRGGCRPGSHRAPGPLCAASPGCSSSSGASAERVWGEVSTATAAAAAKRLLSLGEGGRAPASISKGLFFSFAGFVWVLFLLLPGIVSEAGMGSAAAPKSWDNEGRSNSNSNSTTNNNSNRRRGTPGVATAQGEPLAQPHRAHWLLRLARASTATLGRRPASRARPRQF